MSLNYLKREKNFVAVMEKDYPRIPEDESSLTYILKRLKEEIEELEEESVYLLTLPGLLLIHNDDLEMAHDEVRAAKKECADISNLVDQFFEKLHRVEVHISMRRWDGGPYNPPKRRSLNDDDDDTRKY